LISSFDRHLSSARIAENKSLENSGANTFCQSSAKTALDYGLINSALAPQPPAMARQPLTVTLPESAAAFHDCSTAVSVTSLAIRNPPGFAGG
jgi:hypothetical protein